MVKRYNLGIPKELYDEVKELADEQGCSVLDMFKKLMQIGLVLWTESQIPGTKMFITKGNQVITEIVFP